MQGITFTLTLTVFLCANSLAQSLEYKNIPRQDCAEYAHCLAKLDQLSSGSKIVATTVYLADIADYAAMNQVYEAYFTKDRNDGWKPARNTVQIPLPAGTRMALEATLAPATARLEGLTPPGVVNTVPITPAIRTADRVFIAGILGRDSNTGEIPATPQGQLDVCFSRLRNVFSSAQIAPHHLLSARLYHTAKIPSASIQASLLQFFGERAMFVQVQEVPALALGAQVGIHGVALVKDYAANVKSLDAAVQTLYSVISGPAGQARDWDLFRYLLHPTAQLQAARPTATAAGSIVTMSAEDYVSRNGKTLIEQGFFEEETSRYVQIFERIAHVWSAFAIRRAKDAPVLRTGINSIQLFGDGTRWWVMRVYWDNAR